MSVPMINCPMCSNPMPANAQYCPTCGHTNAFVAPGSAITPSTPRPNPPESGFVTPMAPPVFGAEAGAKDEPSASGGGPTETSSSPGLNASGDTPQGGTPTINIGSPGEAERYTPPPLPTAASTWQPGQYSSDPSQGGQAPGQLPAYSPNPMQPGQVQQQYGQTQGLPQYGAQQSPQYPQPLAPGYGQSPPVNYQYQQQVGVAGVVRRDPTVALLLELLGYVWFLGIGHIYGGRIARGVSLLVAYWLYWGIVAFLFLTLVLAPIGCIMAIIWPLVPILSGLWIKRDLERDNAIFRA